MAKNMRSAAGFSLLEVLVSIVILSLGLLGAVGMLMASLRTTNESAAFTSAVNFVRELSEKSRMNKAVAAKNNVVNAYLIENWKSGDAYPGAGSSGVTCMAATCDPATLAAWDMNDWARRVDKTLPDARIAICFDDAPFSSPTGKYNWACSKTGRNLVVKLGWTPRVASTDEKDLAQRPPRLVMQLIPGQNYDAYSSPSF
jgi:type IV pilus assembly protein PilV